MVALPFASIFPMTCPTPFLRLCLAPSFGDMSDRESGHALKFGFIFGVQGSQHDARKQATGGDARLPSICTIAAKLK